METGDYRLWTPVENALEAYKRRVLNDPGAIYEHIWRLIHIHEALIVTLGAVFAARLLDEWKSKPEKIQSLNELRLLISGTDQKRSKFPSSDSCLSGSIRSWITLLQIFCKKDTLPECNFSLELASYLNEVPIKRPQIAFLDAWRKISPVPTYFSSERLPRIKRFDAISSLRNKLAHVPLPERILSDLHSGLQFEILSSLSPEYTVDQHEKKEDFRAINWHEPLYGVVLTDNFFVTGSDFGRSSDSELETNTIYVGSKSESNSSNRYWPIFPFFNLDKECKISLLFRVPEQDIDAISDNYIVSTEYHRFAAEIEPVRRIIVFGAQLLPWIYEKIKDETEYNLDLDEQQDSSTEISVKTENEIIEKIVSIQQKTELDGTEDPEELRSLAENSFSKKNYKLTIEAFAELLKTGDRRYNDVARSKHGTALWRSAAYDDTIGKEEKIERIENAIKILKKASEHSEATYSARAFYSMSKAHHHLWKITNDDSYFTKSHKNATDATKLGFDAYYTTWLNRLDEEL